MSTCLAIEPSNLIQDIITKYELLFLKNEKAYVFVTESQKSLKFEMT